MDTAQYDLMAKAKLFYKANTLLLNVVGASLVIIVGYQIYSAPPSCTSSAHLERLRMTDGDAFVTLKREGNYAICRRGNITYKFSYTEGGEPTIQYLYNGTASDFE